MEHTHPHYEHTLTRIATFLAGPSEDRTKQERAMERAMARVTDALAVLAERSALGAERSARLNERSSESECRLDAPIHRNLEFEHWMKLLAERSAESRRKLNALIDLMGRCPR